MPKKKSRRIGVDSKQIDEGYQSERIDAGEQDYLSRQVRFSLAYAARSTRYGI
ncbi:MAG: hypothetical protein OXF49_02365 [Candidatus Saccharibacteria bacterium]|nr:hypothetical protein [Candidatus Saccharibacteria bacterium]